MIKAIFIDAKNKSLTIFPVDETNYKASDGWHDIVCKVGYAGDFIYKKTGKIFHHDYDCMLDEPAFKLSKDHDSIKQRIPEGAVIICPKGNTETELEELKNNIVWLEPLDLF